MANLCSTDITLLSSDQAALKKIYDAIEQACSESSYGHAWIGRIGEILGVNRVVNGGSYELDSDKAICSRSKVYQADLEDGQLRIYCEDDWSPYLTIYLRILQKFLKDGKLLYTAIEEGCEVYCSNDPDVIGTYVINVYDDELEEMEDCWCISEEKVGKLIRKVMDTDETDIKKLVTMFEESDFESTIHQIEEVELEVFCA
jgi:hypothetical protein